jgi:hypothetical protein
MPVNTNVQNVKAILDACADYKEVVIDNPKALAIAEEFINDVGGADDNETKAARFLDQIIAIIRSTGRAHVENAQRLAGEASVTAAGDASNSNF